jgi:hypothetical protein
LDAGRIADVGVGARHHHLSCLQGLTQRIERLAAEFGQFVQEQDAVVGQGDLAGLGAQAAAGQGGHACGVMGRAERPGAGQGAAGDQPGHGMDKRGFQQLRGRQGREQPREALGEHGFARSGRADVEQVVTAGRGDLQGPFGALLPLDLLQVRAPRAVQHRTGPG